MFAVIKTGGKQYVVSKDQEISVEKLTGEAGDKVTFNDVLLYADGDTISLGTPLVEGKAIEGKVVAQLRDKKKLVFKYHSKTGYKKRKGHRQHLTKVEITNL